MSIDRPSKIRATVDLDADGKRFGALVVPHSRNDSAWGSIRIPVAVIRNGDGPAALLVAGNHGDEYEGQIALRDLARRSEEHTSELQSLMRISYAVFCLKKKKQ